MAVTNQDVEKLSSTGWSKLEDDKKTELREIAERQKDALYTDRVSTLPELVGNSDDFVKFLSAHLYELAEGGEAQSESATGGSVNYNTVTGDLLSTLTETRYGRVANSMLRNQASVGLVRTR